MSNYPYPPPNNAAGPPQNQDLEHLKLLSIFHYVFAGLSAVGSLFPMIYVGLGFLLMFMPADGNGPKGDEEAMRAMGLIFVAVAGACVLAAWLLAACVFFAGRYLAGRTHYTYCLVLACVSCVFMPLGTALGVFTLIVLLRPSVKALFDARQGYGFG
jgi:hypothetical protein